MKNKLILMVLILLFCENKIKTSEREPYFYDTKVTINAIKAFLVIAKVESSYDTCAYNKDENAKTILQVRKPMILEANRILKQSKFDVYSISNKEAIEIFTIVQNYYNPTYNLKIAAFVHNTGNIDTTGKYGGLKYWSKIKKAELFVNNI